MAELGYWGRTLLGVTTAGIVVATISFLVRLYTRRLLARKLDISDIYMGLGLFAVYGFTSCVIIAAFSGLGHDASELPVSIFRRTSFLFWLDQILWVVAQVFIKLAIIMLLRHTLGTMRRIRAITTGLIVFTIVWGIGSIIAIVFQCWPVQYFWTKSVEGTCISGQMSLYMAMGSLSLVEDVALLLLPIVVVWRLQLIPRQKIQLTLLFSVGTLVCVFSLLRLVEFNHYAPRNLTRSVSLETMWTLLELEFAITCASIVLMRPLFQRCPDFCALPPCLKRIPTFSARSSDFVHFFRQWPTAPTDLSHFSQDTCSEVRSEAHRAPMTEMEP